MYCPIALLHSIGFGTSLLLTNFIVVILVASLKAFSVFIGSPSSQSKQILFASSSLTTGASGFIAIFKLVVLLALQIQYQQSQQPLVQFQKFQQ